MSRGGGQGRAGGLPHCTLCMTWRSRGSKQRFPSRPRLGQSGQESRAEGPLPVKEDALWRARWTQWRERRCGSWDILQRSACQEGWQCPTPEGYTSQRMPARTMPDPWGSDTSPRTSAIQGTEAREYPKLNEKETDIMKLTHNSAILGWKAFWK